jgi:hypothetical protein
MLSFWKAKSLMNAFNGRWIHCLWKSREFLGVFASLVVCFLISAAKTDWCVLYSFCLRVAGIVLPVAQAASLPIRDEQKPGSLCYGNFSPTAFCSLCYVGLNVIVDSP